MRLSTFLAPAFLTLAACGTAEAAKNPRNSVLLSNVKSLTLRNGQKTSARRVSPIPQLKCIGGDAKGLYEVDVMRCKNAGSDYDDESIQWTCQASLPEEFKLGSTDVICEGYDSLDDPYILKGSCGVEYRLMLTSKGLEKYGHRKAGWGSKPDGDDVSQGVSILFWVLFLGVIVWMVFKACIVGGGSAGDPNTWTGPRFDGGGGGGGGGGWGGGPGGDDPPPPYTPRAPYNYGRKSYPSSSSGEQGWRPGFWSGALGGAAAGYYAGSRGNRGGNSSRGGGFWGNDAGEGPSGSYRAPSSSSPSASRHESTGFGETRRR